MKKIFVFTCLIVSYLTGLAQQSTFSNIYYNNQVSPMGNNLTACFDKGALILSNDNYNSGVLIKTDSAGNVLWNKIIRSSTQNYSVLRAYDVVQTNDSNYAIAGTAYDSAIAFNSALCMKLDKNGDTLWTKLISISGHNTEAYHIEQTNDSGFVMTGFVEYNGAPYSEILVAKLNKTGVLQWSKIIQGGTNSNYGYSVKQMADSGYVVCGFTGDVTSGIAFFKLSKTGNLLWAKKFGVGSGISSYACDFIKTPTGFVLSIVTGPSGNEGGLMKTDFSGNILWYHTFQMMNNFVVNSPKPNLVQTSDGGFVFISNSCGGGSFAKCDSLGNILWSYTPAFTANGLDIASDGGFFAGGTPVCTMKSATPSVPQVGLVKADSLGKSACIDTSFVSATFSPIGLIACTYTVSNSGAVSRKLRVTSNSLLLNTDSSCTVSGGGVAENGSHENILIYPSPASETFNLSCTFSGNKQLEITDLTGHVVLRYGFKNKETLVDCASLPNGIYFVNVVSLWGRMVKKVVVSH